MMIGFTNIPKMQHFEPIGKTLSGRPKIRRNTKRLSTPMMMVRKWASKLWFWRHDRKKKPSDRDGTSTPEMTALIDMDDGSIGNDSYLYKSESSGSDGHIVMHFGESFPFWEESPNVEAMVASTNRENHPSKAATDTPDRRIEERDTRLRHSLMKILRTSMSRTGSTTSTIDTTAYSPTLINELDTDDESEHFSISVEPPPTDVTHCVNISVTDQPGFHHAAPLPDWKNRSEEPGENPYSLHDFIAPVVPLDKFMEVEKMRDSDSVFTGPVALADVDAASVGSACLDVAFEGDYPQLVLTPSTDGTVSTRMTDCSSIVNYTRVTLGASFPHPSAGTRAASTYSNHSDSSFDTVHKHTSCTPRWLNESIDKVWKQIDQCKANDTDRGDEAVDRLSHHNRKVLGYGYSTEDFLDLTDELTDGGSYDDGVEDEVDDHRNGSNVASDEEDGMEDSPMKPRKLDGSNCEKEGFAWVDNLWSFSSFEESSPHHCNILTSRIEQDVLHPILKPICHLVEATEIPSPSMCMSKYQRHSTNKPKGPKSSTKAEPSHRHIN